MALDLHTEFQLYNLSVYSTAALKLRPQTVLAIQEKAAQGYIDDFIAWAKEIKKRDLHYRALLDLRYHAVLGLDVIVESASGSRQDVAIANAVREHITENGGFRELVLGLLDGIEKGFSVVEIIWEPQGRLWVPRFLFRDQRYFAIYEGREIGLKGTLVKDRAWIEEYGIDLSKYQTSMTTPDFLPLPPYKFAWYVPTATDPIPLNAIAYSAMFHHTIKMFGIQAFASYVETYGMPFRVGKYDNSATPTDIDVLKDAIRTIGTQASAVIPDSMALEMLSVPTSGAQPFRDLIHLINDEISKLVLGQVRTMDESSTGLARASESTQRDSVRQDILESDTRIAHTINSQVVRPFVDLNYGVTRYPRVSFHLYEENDIQVLDTVSKFIPLGLKVPQGYIRDQLGIPDPVEGEDILGGIEPATDDDKEVDGTTPPPTGEAPPPEDMPEDDQEGGST